MKVDTTLNNKNLAAKAILEAKLAESENKLIQCPFCEGTVKPKKVKRHIARVHKITLTNAFVTEYGRKRDMTTKKSGFYLISKIGSVVSGKECCDNCGQSSYDSIRDAKSNRGPLLLCNKCNKSVRSQSRLPVKTKRKTLKKPKGDAMYRAVTGGGFETNRRKF